MDKKVVRFRGRGNNEGDLKMYMGDILKSRMNALDVSVSELAAESLMEESEIIGILENNIRLDEIDPLSLEFISQTLYCSPEYFSNENIRNKDLINASMNRGISDVKANFIKGRLQQFANDYMFLKNIILETKGGDKV